MKGLCDQSSPQMGSFLPNGVGRIAQHVRKGGGRKEGKDGVGIYATIFNKIKINFIVGSRYPSCGGILLYHV